MTWKELESIFNRSMGYAFSRKKLFFIFPILATCGLLLVFCRALAVNAHRWVAMSLTFLPIFLCSGILLAAGVMLTRIYHNEIKHYHISYRTIFLKSWELLIGISYLVLPLLLAYLLLWIVMGLFYLLKEIPMIGEGIGIVLSFAPFLLVLGSIVLILFTLFLLFFFTPQVALQSGVRLSLAKDLFKRFNRNIFSNCVLFFISLFPLICTLAFLSLSAIITKISFVMSEQTLSIALQWFFIMIPFSALLSPSVLFFFNFAVESYVLIDQKVAQKEPAFSAQETAE